MHTYLVYLFAGRKMEKARVQACNRQNAMSGAETTFPGFKAASAFKIDII